MLIHIKESQIHKSEIKSLSHFHQDIIPSNGHHLIRWFSQITVFKERAQSWSINLSNVSWSKLVAEDNLPKSGMVIDGICYHIIDLKITTNNVTDWPTPGASDSIKSIMPPTMFNRVLKRIETGDPILKRKDGGDYQESLSEKVMRKEIEPKMWQENSAVWPTPTASDWKGPNKSGSGSASSRSCATFVSMYPTPTTRDWKGARHPDTLAAKGRDCRNSLPDLIRVQEIGHLNPDWVEWLMNFPLLWSKADKTILKDITKKPVKNQTQIQT